MIGHADARGNMNKEELIQKAKDPKYIAGIYNYCDRWCQRCSFTSRCLNCTLLEDQAGDLEAVDITNEKFWKNFSDILRDIRELLEDLAREEGIDLESLAAQEEILEDIDPPTDIISHLSDKYASAVNAWFDSHEYSVHEKEAPRNRIHLVSSERTPVAETVDLTDAVEVIRWYQHFIHVKLARAFGSAADEADYDDGFAKDSDGSAKVALIGIDRSMAAWRILTAHLAENEDEMIRLIEMLENLRVRVENRFPNARTFVRPGFDETPSVAQE